MILLQAITTSCAQVKLFDGDFESLQKKARRRDQPFVVEFYTSWCGYCKKFDRDVLQSRTVGEYLNDRFIVYKLNAEEEVSIAKRYGVSGYPTILIFNSKGDVVEKVAGYIGETQFLQLVKSLRAKEKELSLNFDQYKKLAEVLYKEDLKEWKLENADRSDFLIELQTAVAKKDIITLEDLRIDHSNSEQLILLMEETANGGLSVNQLIEGYSKQLLSHTEVSLFLQEKLLVNNEKVSQADLKLINELLLEQEDVQLLTLKVYVLDNLGLSDQSCDFKKDVLKKVKTNNWNIDLIRAINC